MAPDERGGHAESDEPRHRLQRGQATAELSLVFGLLVALFIVIFDFGHILSVHAAVITASREAARYGAAVGDNGSGTPRYVDCAGIRQAARRITSGLISLSDGQIRISYDDGSGSSRSQACPPHGSGPAASEITRLDRIEVEVTYTYQALTPVVSAVIGPMTVVSVDRRTIVKRAGA